MNIKNLLLACILCIPTACSIQAQTNNTSMHFDGNGHYITRDISLSPLVTSNSDFTVELWFSITSPITGTCGTPFKRLFALYEAPTVNNRFEVGECDHELHIYYPTPTGYILQAIAPALPPGCHHLAVIRSGTSLNMYLNGSPTPIYTGTIGGTLTFNTFRLGHWGGGATPGQDWMGTMDDVRLWSIPRTPVQIQDFKDSSLHGPWPGLVLSWTFDQAGVTPAGNNTIITSAQDMSGSGNDGSITGFTLSGTTSNFVQNLCPKQYDVSISDLPALFPISLASICSGDDVHFCITQNGTAIPPLSGSTSVDWYYSDDNGINWTLDPLFVGYCFYAPHVTYTGCSTSTTGNIGRKYCAKINTGSGGLNSVYTTSAQDLTICCPIAPATISLSPQPPLPPGITTLCEGNVSIDVTLNGPLFLPNMTINWFVDGNPYTPSNPTSFTYNGPANPANSNNPNQLCFEAVIQNCVCPAVNVKTCIDVDPQPVCGTIDGMSSNLIPTSIPYEYTICPGNDAIVGIVAPFTNCNPVWQYHLDTDPAGTWKDLLGTSNSVQNTNILAQLAPPNNPLSPYLWTSTTTCITYRVECRPYNYPNSGCPPCISNEVKICLQPEPVNSIITGGSNQICCMGGTNTSLLTVSPYTPNLYNYEWFQNGVTFVGNGQTYLANQAGCYVVQISDMCASVTTPPFCIDICTPVPIIDCPIANPCACIGQPITLSGCNSYNTCTNTGPLPLIYTWSANNGGTGTTGGINGCEFTHTPDINGTTYTLIVTDPNLGNCSASTTLVIKPCQP
ncbi:hypothetical protein C7N43_31595 [Sphingobacteriales bacterium UPWRP_1]|nr:hypothetical protein BVG80_01580 [Sphingobacteriales bacterium TSM_CSM]PSJ72938.1 hypothetical protein C7N43_31595 [Sphingobacteriales bacterium UPWRP_1]